MVKKCCMYISSLCSVGKKRVLQLQYWWKSLYPQRHEIVISSKKYLTFISKKCFFNTAKFIFNILVNDKHVEHTLISKLSLAQIRSSSLNIMLVHVIWDTSKWFYPHYWWNHSSCFTFLHILKSITVNVIIKSIQSTFTRGQSPYYTSHNVLDGVTDAVHE